jgi:leucyl-tRNA synthetase
MPTACSTIWTGLDWPEHIKKMQRDWIGRSVGARIRFPVSDQPDLQIEVFTTRPDTLYGATYMVLAPEHELVERITTPEQAPKVREYVEAAARRSERARIADAESKTGVFTGAFADNPADGRAIPIWIADYVLAGYGTGAIMAVPAHDQRDYAFARCFDLPIVEVVAGGNVQEAAFTGPGVAVNSGLLDGLETERAKERMIEWLARRGRGERAVTYKLRDWLFSRQRYWGEPFPVFHLEDGSIELVPEDQLPIELPPLDDFKPKGGFESPLSRVRDWVEVRHPITGASVRRDPNTMPQWAGSCWYYLRFCDPHNDREPWSREAERYWMPVDLYVGGAEHAVLHLLYARFWHKVLYDLDLVSTVEPFARLLNQGMIQGKSYRCYCSEDSDPPKFYGAGDVRYEGETPVHRGSGDPLKMVWVPTAEVRWSEDRPLAPRADVQLEEVIEKMSKSRGNVVTPDDVIAEYGADSMRLYEMFIGPLQKAAPWSTDGIPGVFRFLQRVHRLYAVDDGGDDVPRALPDGPGSEAQQRLLARTIADVTRHMDALEFNTAISSLMIFARDIEKEEPMPHAIGESFIKLLAPLAPHLAEEIWQRLGHRETITYEPWPEPDPARLVDAHVEVVVQIAGKTRGRVRVAAEAAQDQVLAAALADASVQKHVGSATPRRVVYVPGRLINIVP